MKIVGLKIRTTNENAQAQKEIPALWHKFMDENVADKLSNRLSDNLYVAYFEYEKDFMKPYSCLIGFEVDANTTTPPGLESHVIPTANYKIFETPSEQILEKWIEIWQAPLKRSYQTDFEVYNPSSPTALIHIGLE